MFREKYPDKPDPKSVMIHLEKNKWYLYSDPVNIYTTDKIDDVEQTLRNVSTAADNGFFAAGFVSYEASGAFDSSLKTHEPGKFPLIWFGIYRKPELIAIPEYENEIEEISDFNPETDISDYLISISKVKEYIKNGDTYQVNYSIRTSGDFTSDTWRYFLQKITLHPVPYGSYIDTGTNTILSLSPELFYSLDGRIIKCSPMKGTAERGLFPEKDEENRISLIESDKNRAENIMIVDMIRNDLGKIADTGSVKVEDLFRIETYRTVHQMVSDVKALTDADTLEIFRALFPCASVTGAPKKRTTEIIHELETSPRNVYCGAIGYIHPGRKQRFSVPIRTMIVDNKNKQAVYSVGSGVVADSTDTAEYEECLTKARILSMPSKRIGLLETILFEEHYGFFLKDFHTDRMFGSARYFGFSIKRNEIEEYIDSLANGINGKARVRILFDNVNGFTSTVSSVTEGNKPLRISFAKKPVNSQNVFLYHKTTIRDELESAEASFHDSDDIILWNERDEITETRIGNIVAEIKGKKITPHFECGLLRGVFRRYLLEKGEIEEGIIRREGLLKADRVYRINSVRKWERCELLMQ